MNIAPVLRLRGAVHNCSMRNVPEQPAVEAERDPESGRIVRDPIDYRAAYDVLDVVVHTDDGGYASVVFKGDHFEQALGGAVPDQGAVIDWPVRCFTLWAGRAGRRYPSIGYSVAGEVIIAEHQKAGSRRSDAAA